MVWFMLVLYNGLYAIYVSKVLASLVEALNLLIMISFHQTELISIFIALIQE